MRSLLGFAAVVTLALATTGYAQESRKQPVNAQSTQATYMVSGLH